MLKEKNLLRTESYIAGQWTKTSKRFSVFNPCDGSVVAEVAEAGAQEAEQAVEAAHQAFKSWKSVGIQEKAALLFRWQALITKHWDDLATLLTLEQGKPYEQATHELMGNRGQLSWCAEEIKRLLGLTIPSSDPDRRFMTLKQPLGVVAAITPWNFPSVLPMKQCVPALAAGCTVVLKPSEETPLSALALAELAHRAAIPPGVFNVLACQNPDPVGQVLTTHRLVRKVIFTGSTAVGKQLCSRAGQGIKNVTMELGGNCPALIFDDADVDLAAEKTFWFKFYNAGQCCNNINRLFVHEAVYDQFVEKFKAMVDKHLSLGSGLCKTTSVGPLINEAGIKKCERLVKDSCAKGANLVCGGKRADIGPLFYEPTLLTNVNQDMAMYREEIFGPVAPVYRFASEEEGIALANDTEYGLASYLFSKSIGRTWRVAEQLEAGSVGVNTTDVVAEVLPFGGWKESGLGREGGAQGSLDPYCEAKALIIAGIGS